MNLFQRFCMALLFIGLGACATPQHVDFSNRLAFHGQANTTRVYLDANGNKYPSEGEPAGGFRLRDHRGSLLNAMRAGTCAGASKGSETDVLCTAARRAKCDDTGWCDLSDWHAIQAAAWDKVARHIARRRPQTIVLLIHGFNTTAAESSPNFDKAKLAIMDAAADPRGLHFVEVYWDGCTGNALGLGCWSRAQANGPLVGLALRPLINALTEQWAARSMPPVRVLTHSSGAFVAGSLFGNPVAALSLLQDPTRNPRYRRFKALADEEQGSWRVPQLPDLRVGMLAAATAPALVTGSGLDSQGWLTRNALLMIAIHPRDEALNKKFGWCDFAGYTCLGARFDDFCKLVQSDELTRRGVGLRAYDFDRMAWPWQDDQTAHNFGVYVVQAAEKTSFIRDLFGSGRPPAPSSGVHDNEDCRR